MIARGEGPVGRQRYKILFEGSLVPGTDPGEVKRRLASGFSLGQETIEALLAGGNWLIAHGIDGDSAQKLSAFLEQAGVRTRIRPVFPPGETADVADITRLEIFAFAGYPFSPLVMAPAKPVHVENEEGRTVFEVRSAKVIFGRLFAFVISAVVVFFLQYALTRQVADWIDSTVLVTALSIVFYFGAIYILFSLLAGKKRLRLLLCSDAGEPFLEMKKTGRFVFRHDACVVLDGAGETLGHIRKDIFEGRYEAFDEAGALVYTAERTVRVREIALKAAVALRENLVDSAFLDRIQRRIWKEADEEAGGAAIVDAGGEIVARFTRGEKCEIYIRRPKPNPSDRLLLIALSVFLSGF